MLVSPPVAPANLTLLDRRGGGAPRVSRSPGAGGVALTSRAWPPRYGVPAWAFTGPLLSPSVLGGCSAHAAHAMRHTPPIAYDSPTSAPSPALSAPVCPVYDVLRVRMFRVGEPFLGKHAVKRAARPSASTVSTLSTGSPSTRVSRIMQRFCGHGELRELVLLLER